MTIFCRVICLSTSCLFSVYLHSPHVSANAFFLFLSNNLHNSTASSKENVTWHHTPPPPHAHCSLAVLLLINNWQQWDKFFDPSENRTRGARVYWSCLWRENPSLRKNPGEIVLQKRRRTGRQSTLGIYIIKKWRPEDGDEWVIASAHEDVASVHHHDIRGAEPRSRSQYAIGFRYF